MHTEANSSARILDAALKLFSEKGYEGTSTREICELAGITKPTLYYFFESKEGVYRALIKKAFDQNNDIIAAGLAMPGSLRDRLKKIAELTFESVRAHPALLRFLFSAVYSLNSPLAQHVQCSHETMLVRLIDEVNAAVERGEITAGNMEARMTILAGSLVEAISNSLISGKPDLTQELAHAIVDMIFDGWEPSR